VCPAHTQRLCVELRVEPPYAELRAEPRVELRVELRAEPRAEPLYAKLCVEPRVEPCAKLHIKLRAAGSLRAYTSHIYKISKRLLSPTRAAIKNAEELQKSISSPQLTL